MSGFKLDTLYRLKQEIGNRSEEYGDDDDYDDEVVIPMWPVECQKFTFAPGEAENYTRTVEVRLLRVHLQKYSVHLVILLDFLGL